MSGWIKLHKKIKEWEWYKDGPCFKLFMHCLLSAQYEPSRYQGYEIQAGSFVTGRMVLSAQSGLSEQHVRTAMLKLENTGELTIKKTNKFSIITVVKWNEYQTINQPITNNQPTDNQQITTYKEYKNIRKKELKTDTDSSFDEFWKAYPKDRIGSKDKARSAYLKALTRASKEDIHAGLEKYRTSSEVAGGYAKGAAAWLNDDRWTTIYRTDRKIAETVAKQSSQEENWRIMNGKL